MSKKQALTEFHRGSILAAADRLFTEKGIERTTMDDIAREAEYSKATLYVYFQSKAEIINAILHNGMVVLRKKIREAVESQEDWLLAYDALSTAVIRFHDDNPTAFDAATGQTQVEVGEGIRGSAEIIRVGKEIDEELTAFLKRGIAAGVVRADLSPAETVPLLWAALAGIVRTSGNRTDYIKEQSGLDREEYLKRGSHLLLVAITGKTD